MDQNLKTDAVTLTKTLCAHLAAARFGDLTAAAKREARRGVLSTRATAPTAPPAANGTINRIDFDG